MKRNELGFSRPFLIIVGSIVLVLVSGYLWGLQTMFCLQFRHFAKKTPILMLIPQELQKVSSNLTEGIGLSHAGFAFEVPWNDLDKEKSKIIGNAAIFAFRSGRVITFYGPSPTHEDLLSEVEKQFGDRDKGNLKKLFGPEATKTNYAFHKAMLEETSSTLRPWMSEREAIRSSMLLTIKAISSVGGDTGLFKVESNGWNGFQFDDPAKKPRRITLELYDSRDRHVELILASKKDAGIDITQADVNRVLDTLKPVDQLSASETITQSNPKTSN